MALLLITLLTFAAPQLPPPNLVENGDARAGELHWTRSRFHKPMTAEGEKDATVEPCDMGPCFVLRNSAAWNQHIRLHEDPTDKFLLIVARGSPSGCPLTAASRVAHISGRA